jgi:hypothetical protein
MIVAWIRSSTTVMTRSGNDAAAASPSCWRELEERPDLGRHRLHAGGKGEDRGRAEKRHRLQERDQETGEEGGRDERQRDVHRRLQERRAKDRRCLFEIARNEVEAVGDEREHVGKGVERHHEHHPQAEKMLMSGVASNAFNPKSA